MAVEGPVELANVIQHSHTWLTSHIAQEYTTITESCIYVCGINI